MVAPIRFATKRSRSGCTVRSFLPTMYQLGFDLHAVPFKLLVEEVRVWHALGSPKQVSVSAPALANLPRSMRCHLASARSDHLRLRCGRRRLCAGKLSCWLCDVSSASGASAQM